MRAENKPTLQRDHQQRINYYSYSDLSLGREID